jgi:hypothetical protein
VKNVDLRYFILFKNGGGKRVDENEGVLRASDG